MQRTIEIKLTPLGPFFFGQEVVFGGGFSADERRRSYLVHSGILPQQTTLLGMLRETILRRNDALLHAKSTAQDRDRAASLVGVSGFSAANNAAKSDYGVIKRISPLILEDEAGKRWQPHPLDGIAGKEGAELHWCKVDSAGSKAGKDTWLLKSYDPKEELKLQFSSGTEEKKLSKFFGEQVQVGNLLMNRRAYQNTRIATADKDEGLFRQTMQRNKKSVYAEARAAEKKSEELVAEQRYSFVFRAELDSSGLVDFKDLVDTTVVMGGERSTFELSVTEVEKELAADSIFAPVKYKQKLTEGEEYARLVLLSDTFLPAELLRKENVFPVAHSKPFRFFSTRLQKTTAGEHTENFYYLAYDKQAGKYKSEGRHQSKRYNLLERGGVIVGRRSALEKLGKIIEDYQAFHQIGYNFYSIV